MSFNAEEGFDDGRDDNGGFDGGDDFGGGDFF